MDESTAARRKRYDEIIENQCKHGCRGYRPRLRTQCNIYKHLLVRQDSDLVEKESVMLDGPRCRGYVSKEAVDGQE